MTHQDQFVRAAQICELLYSLLNVQCSGSNAGWSKLREQVEAWHAQRAHEQDDWGLSDADLQRMRKLLLDDDGNLVLEGVHRANVGAFAQSCDSASNIAAWICCTLFYAATDELKTRAVARKA